MTRAFASFVTWLSLLGVLVVSGGYTVAYLFSWQWMRAQIAGLAFVAALVVVSAMAVMARIRRLERRLDALLPVAATRTPSPPPDVEPRPDFRWLSTPTPAPALLAMPLLDGLRAPDGSVFIPVFLATGLVVAGLASVVERISALRHGRAVAVAPRPPPPPGTPRAAAIRPFVLVPLISAAVVAAVVTGLWRTAHYRSEPIGPGVTTLVVDVSRSTPEGQPWHVSRDKAVAVVGEFCTVHAGVDVRLVGVTPGRGGSTLLRVRPLLDAAAQQRFSGCVEDAILDRHSLHVLATRLTPD
jgi:hypothetical protein